MKTLKVGLRIGILLGSSIVALHAQDSPTELPLALEDFGGAQRLVIYVGIDGSAPLPYLFDTGSATFNAAYYDGPMVGGATNNSDWSNTGTNVSAAHYDYGSGATAFGYEINEVTVTNIAIYNPGTTTVAEYLTSSNGFSIGQAFEKITKTTDTNPDYTDRAGTNYDYVPFFTNQLSQGLPPEPPGNSQPAGGGLYGTFGAGLFAGITSNSPTGLNFTNGSVLGQATTTGWAVVANATNPYAILGLNSGITNQFSTAVPWKTNSAIKFPNSGANSGTEFDTDFGFTISGGTNDPVSWTNATLLDSGTPDNNLTAAGIHADKLANYTNAYGDKSDSVIAGNLITTHGKVTNSGVYSFTTTQQADPVTYNAALDPGDSDSHSTLGIGFFLSNSVAFDLQNTQTLYTGNVVTVVPEASSYALFGIGLGALALKIVRRRRLFKEA